MRTRGYTFWICWCLTWAAWSAGWGVYRLTHQQGWAALLHLGFLVFQLAALKFLFWSKRKAERRWVRR